MTTTHRKSFPAWFLLVAILLQVIQPDFHQTQGPGYADRLPIRYQTELLEKRNREVREGDHTFERVDAGQKVFPAPLELTADLFETWSDWGNTPEQHNDFASEVDGRKASASKGPAFTGIFYAYPPALIVWIHSDEKVNPTGCIRRRSQPFFACFFNIPHQNAGEEEPHPSALT
jgi:hypothetical protein